MGIFGKVLAPLLFITCMYSQVEAYLLLCSCPYATSSAYMIQAALFRFAAVPGSTAPRAAASAAAGRLMTSTLPAGQWRFQTAVPGRRAPRAQYQNWTVFCAQFLIKPCFIIWFLFPITLIIIIRDTVIFIKVVKDLLNDQTV